MNSYFAIGMAGVTIATVGYYIKKRNTVIEEKTDKRFGQISYLEALKRGDVEHLDMYLYLMDCNKYVQLYNEENFYPISILCKHGHTDAVSLFICKGADVNPEP